MDGELFVFVVMAVFGIACCLAERGRRLRGLELALEEQLRRSSDTIRGAPLD